MPISADDATKPLDSDAVNYPASAGAGELRALKAKINAVFLAAGINADGEFLVTTNNTGLYAKVNANPSSNTKILYGFASDVTRTGKDNHVVGGQFSAYLGAGVNLTGSNGVFGLVSQAISNATGMGNLIGGEMACCNFNPDYQSHAIWGCNIVFKDRLDGAVTPASGLGVNKYNVGAKAIVLTSQTRGTAGEYCGWTTGLYFDEYSMDADSVNARGHAIDFKALHYDGGADPATAYRCASVIRMRALQSIILDDSGLGVVRLYFDPFSSRVTINNSGTERWGVDVGTGQVYKNGVLQY